MKSGTKCIIKGRSRRKSFSQKAFQPGPEFFNGIEFWGVGRKEQQPASSVMGSKKQPLFGMERSIIHYNRGSLFQRRQKLVGKPEFKKTAVHRPVILKRRKNPVAHLSGDNAAALILSTTNLSKHLLAPQRIPIFSIQVCIYPAFIHIGNLFRRYILDCFLVCRYFLPVLLLVAGRLFFLVILCRRSASWIPLSLHPNASAISDWYASGCSATYAFSFSGSIFRKLLCSSFFPKSPVSFSCFSHFCIVDLDTLKT